MSHCVLICISPMANDVEHLFKYLRAVCISLEKCLFKSLHVFVWGWFFKFYFWLCWVFVDARGLSLVAASGGYSLLQCAGFSLQWLLLLWSTGSRHLGFSSCGTGLVAPRCMGSSQTRVQTCVPCIGRQILNNCTTREAQAVCYLSLKRHTLTPTL